MKQITPLKLAIVASGRHQKDIAAELGVLESTLSRWANGLHVPDERRQLIADVLGRDVAELFPEARAA